MSLAIERRLLTPISQQTILLNRIDNLHQIPRRERRPNQLTLFPRVFVLRTIITVPAIVCPDPPENSLIRGVARITHAGVSCSDSHFLRAVVALERERLADAAISSSISLHVFDVNSLGTIPWIMSNKIILSTRNPRISQHQHHALPSPSPSPS